MDKLALKIVYNQIDKLVEQEDGPSFDYNAELKFILNDPFYKPDSSIIKTLIK